MSRIASDRPALHVPFAVQAGECVQLPAEEERHLRALRLTAGDPVLLLDGNGGRADAVVEAVGRRDVRVRIVGTVLEGPECETYIVAAIGALADRSRFEWFVEKATELGVREIIPLVTRRAEGRTHVERARRIAVAAMKQSQRSYLPSISEPVPLHEMIGGLGRFDHVYLCHESAPRTESLARALLARPTMQRIALLVGSEGGFTEEEVALARDAGASVVSLGDARLRAETAAIVAAALVASLCEISNG